METKSLKNTTLARTGSPVTHAFQAMFTFAKNSALNGLLWTYKGWGTEPGTETSHCQNSARPWWSCVSLPKPMSFLVYSSIKWHLWRNKISFKCWKPHTFGEEGIGDGSIRHWQQMSDCSPGEDRGQKSEQGWIRKDFLEILYYQLYH